VRPDYIDSAMRKIQTSPNRHSEPAPFFPCGLELPIVSPLAAAYYAIPPYQ